ncbi:hypothetical protein G5V59_19250 [Nocardioides sp. W3-2-3]|nr:hypothetical protein [Nocardioides convexus]
MPTTPSATSTPAYPELVVGVTQLKPRLAVMGEMVDLAKPIARLAAQHVDNAHLAAQQVTPPSLLEPVTLERSIATAGKEPGPRRRRRAPARERRRPRRGQRPAVGRHRHRDHRQRPPADGRTRPRPGASPSSGPGLRIAGTVGGRTLMDLDQGGRQARRTHPRCRGPRRTRPGRRPDRTAGRRAACARWSRCWPPRSTRARRRPRQQARPRCASLAINAAAPMFGTTPEAILSAERSRPVSDARAVAMTAARETGLSLPAIAEHFNKDHGSVIHAVRRTAERPRLADAAARVSEHINSRYTARLPRSVRAEENVVDLPQRPPSSTFEPDGPVEHAVVAAADAFNTTPEVLLGTDRSRAAADARAVAMAAARIHGHSLPTIARHFERDHTTVLLATRRIEKTPPLRDLAAKIAADLPEQPAGAGRLDVDEHVPESSHRSLGLREEQRAIPVAGQRAQAEGGPVKALIGLAAAAVLALTAGGIKAAIPGVQSGPEPAEGRTTRVRVTAVVDGDTIRVETLDGRQARPSSPARARRPRSRSSAVAGRVLRHRCHAPARATRSGGQHRRPSHRHRPAQP